MELFPKLILPMFKSYTVFLFSLSADIYDQICSELEPKSFECECVGGGRIEHKKNEQTLFVYGYSMVSVLNHSYVMN